MDIQKEIIDTIELMVSKMVEKMNLSSDVSSVVQDIEIVNKRNKVIKNYKVKIQGRDYMVYDGVDISPQVGQRVWIHIPYGNYDEAYICALDRKEG